VSASLDDIEAVYRTRGADFARLALARTGDRDSARDAVQDGFANAVRQRGSFRATGSLEAWIARCVINAAHDMTRGRHDDDAAVPDGESPVSEPGADSAVRDAVRQLPLRQREALFLRFYLDFDYATIAETLDIEVGTVSATLHGARAALARALEEVAT
jgi:RNA polymerase sigma factor (sigma-70 family)